MVVSEKSDKIIVWHGCYDGGWRGLITPEAFAHPAKFAPRLIDRIYAHGLSRGWWRKGDTIGDPFGGIAGGGIFAGYRGLNWIGVELEDKFVALGNANILLHAPKWMVLGDAWRVLLVQGDSRQFARIVGGVSAVVTSPPYADQGIEKSSSKSIDIRKNWETYRESGGGSSFEAYAATQAKHSAGYGGSDGQIGALKGGTVDAVVTSPPWENQEASMDAGKFKDPATFAAGMTARDGTGTRNGTTQASRLAQFNRDTATEYGQTEGQLGNAAGETYWQAMHQVYGQCLLALKPGGVMCVVVKDYVKDKQRVPLCDQTLRLLNHLGFETVERIHAMLVKETRHAGLFREHVERKERKSFFRRLAEKKGSPRIDWEEVLVVRKRVSA